MKHQKWKVKIKKGKSEKCSVKLKVKSEKWKMKNEKWVMKYENWWK